MLTGRLHALACRIDDWQWLVLIVAAPLFLFIRPALSPVLLLIPLLWGAAWIARRRPVPVTPLNGTLLLLAFMLLVSLYATYDLAASLPKVSGMILAFGVFFQVVRLSQSRRGWWGSLAFFFACGLGIVALSVLDTQWASKVGGLDVLTSRLAPHVLSLPGAEQGLNPNELAGTLLWILPLSASLAGFVLLHTRAFWGRLGWRMPGFSLFLALNSAILLLAIVLLQSRSAYAGLAVAGVMLAAFAWMARRRAMVFAAVAIIALLSVSIFAQGSGTLNVVDLAGSSGVAADSTQGRLEIWSRALYAIQDFPFTGMGLNTFRTVVHLLYPLFIIPPGLDIAHAHNEFLQAALDLGLPGLVAFLALYLTTFWMLRELWESPATMGIERALWRTIILGLTGGLLAHAVFGLTDAIAFGARPGVLFWMLLALITGLFLQVQRDQVRA